MGRSARAASLAFLLGATGLLLGVTAAEAHSNQSVVRLAVSTDRGVTTIRAFLVYRNDQQPVIDEFVLGEVTGDTGSRSFQLQPVQRRPGYFASPVHLAPGHWTLTVTAKAATVGSASGTLTIDPAGHLSQTALSGSFDPAALPVAGHPASGSMGGCRCRGGRPSSSCCCSSSSRSRTAAAVLTPTSRARHQGSSGRPARHDPTRPGAHRTRHRAGCAGRNRDARVGARDRYLPDAGDLRPTAHRGSHCHRHPRREVGPRHQHRVDAGARSGLRGRAVPARHRGRLVGEHRVIQSRLTHPTTQRAARSAPPPRSTGSRAREHAWIAFHDLRVPRTTTHTVLARSGNMPAVITTWTLPLRSGQRPVTVTGELTWHKTPVPISGLALLAILAVAFLAFLAFASRRLSGPALRDQRSS